MKKTAIILVTDGGFLVPTLVVCKQLAARSAVTDIADIIVYLVDVDDNTRLKLKSEFKYAGIYFEPLTSKSFVPGKDVYFHQNHVPVVSLARLALSESISRQYENILYLDGDLQIVGDVSPLVRYVVPEGKIAVCRGALWLENITENEHWRSYLSGLGGVDANQYFNAGVLAFRRETWSDLAPRALQFFFDNSKQCERHDQSALNAVCKGRTVELAPAYNFHSPYAALYVQHSYRPAIIHFTGPNKPWKYAGLPWGTQFMHSYTELLGQHPFLNDFLSVPGKISISQQAALCIKDAADTLRHPRALIRKRAKFFQYVRTHKFPF